MTERYGAIVFGLGAMGSAASYHLARSMRCVLGLDAYPRGHSRGIREAYAELPHYVFLSNAVHGVRAVDGDRAPRGDRAHDRVVLAHRPR